MKYTDMYEYRKMQAERVSQLGLHFKTECGRQTCALCPENHDPVSRRTHNARRAGHEFVSSGDGCYHIFIGKPAVRVCEQGCDCNCHDEE